MFHVLKVQRPFFCSFRKTTYSSKAATEEEAEAGKEGEKGKVERNCGGKWAEKFNGDDKKKECENSYMKGDDDKYYACEISGDACQKTQKPYEPPAPASKDPASKQEAEEEKEGEKGNDDPPAPASEGPAELSLQAQQQEVEQPNKGVSTRKRIWASLESGRPESLTNLERSIHQLEAEF